MELAYMDLLARMTNHSLSSLARRHAPAHSGRRQPWYTAQARRLLERVDRYLALGYQRIKLKIKPGWDVDVVADVRQRYPDILLSVDANSAYTIDDKEHLKRLDDFNLLMIEQPLEHDDLLDHARLQREFATPICLDESITGLRQAEEGA